MQVIVADAKLQRPALRVTRCSWKIRSRGTKASVSVKAQAFACYLRVMCVFAARGGYTTKVPKELERLQRHRKLQRVRLQVLWSKVRDGVLFLHLLHLQIPDPLQ